ncbi:glycosyltransferase [Novosphingobium aerophilum]|uniref:glycosyltransferase n=1 Tax=Novosphingobium TaxID=165696 RepID=UPI0012CD9B9D|nr:MULTISPECIES: glycosyltransferase [unclassified Novosphingobium]MPS70278.1 glycosyltransferase [Novosphingobium sp.]WRT93733.1 glycosyltransferase [Novosphingobium sp. RL4]
MKVLHVTQKLPGGPASYLGELLPYQRAALGDANVSLVACGDELGHLPGFPRSSVHAFDSSGRGPVALLGFMRTAMSALLAERPTVVHLHSTFPGLLRLPIAALPASRRPAVVYCSHGWAFNMDSANWKRGCYAGVERLLAPLGQRTIAISDFERRSALSRGIRAENMVVVENGVSAAPPELLLPAADMRSDVLNLLFIGRLDEQKGFDVLEAAMATLVDRPVHLHVIGDRVVSNGQSLVSSLPNVTHYGWRDRSQVPGFIEKADVVVMPSRWEGFGLVAIEAMRQGRPVLASRVDALPEVVGEAGMLVRPGDPEALSYAISRLDRAELKMLGEKARLRFQERFTSERMNAEILRCYHEALGARRRA